MSIVEISEVSLAELDSERSWGRYIDLPKPGSRTGGHDGIEIEGWALGRSSSAAH
jgi:hypothetical protein